MSWVDRRLTDNSTTQDDILACNDFMLGRARCHGDGSQGDGRQGDAVTERVTVSASDDRPPYHDYQRYRVSQRVSTSSQEHQG